MRSDIVIGGGLLAFAGAYGYLTLELPAQQMPHTLGPDFVPTLLTGLLLLLATLLIFIPGRPPPEGARPLPRGAIGRTVFLVALMAAYTASMGLVGYFLTTPFFLGGTIWLAGERRPTRMLFWAIILFAGIHFLLRILFSVPLPLGPLD
ncbi:MAG: tripartite tricarboxylate transporter TctB family protein [Candidatus Methylomirabilales bacterium]